MPRFDPQFRIPLCSGVCCLFLLNPAFSIEEGVPTEEIYLRLAELPYTCPPGSC